MTAEDELRQLFEGWAEAIRAKDAEGSLAGYASDLVAFDLIEPLQYRGADAVRRRLDEWFAGFDGPIDFEHRDLTISSGDDVAFAHSINHVTGSLKDRQRLEMYWRATMCFRKIDGKWTAVHTHTSVPFDMQTGEASLDLEP